MAAGTLEGLEAYLKSCIERMSPAQRVQLGRRIGTVLQKANAERIAGQVDPDGAAFSPRKQPRELRGRRRRSLRSRRKNGPMFLRARAKKYLRIEATSGESRVGYVGAMARIMTVHQDGLEDHVTRDPRSPTVKYDARRVLGFGSEDRLKVLEMVERHLAA